MVNRYSEMLESAFHTLENDPQMTADKWFDWVYQIVHGIMHIHRRYPCPRLYRRVRAKLNRARRRAQGKLPPQPESCLTPFPRELSAYHVQAVVDSLMSVANAVAGGRRSSYWLMLVSERAALAAFFFAKEHGADPEEALRAEYARQLTLLLDIYHE